MKRFGVIARIAALFIALFAINVGHDQSIANRGGIISSIASVAQISSALAQTNIIGGGLRGDLKVSGGASFSLTAGANIGSATTGTTAITYSGVSWGSGCNAAIFLIYWYNTVATDTIVSVAVSGNSPAAQVAGAYSGGSTLVTTDIYQLNSPSGTSANITVTYSGLVTYNSNVTAYCLVSSHTAATATNFVEGACANSIALPATTIPSGGRAVVAAQDTAGQTISFTNATLDSSYTGGGIAATWGHTTATGSTTVTINTAGADTCVGSIAAYGP